MSEKKIIKIEPIMAVVCDDIRKESNGKTILIGMYTGGMTLSGRQGADFDNTVNNLMVHIWMPFNIEEPGIASFELKIQMPNPLNKQIISMELVISEMPQSTEILPIEIGPIPLKIWESGNLEIAFKNDGEEEFKILRTMPITYNVIPTNEVLLS